MIRWRARKFWKWFRSISDTLLEVIRTEHPSSNLAAWVTELNRRTAAYHPAVRAVLGLTADAPELVLTAEGNLAGAEPVRLLAASQPPLPGWTIRAFKPPLTDCVVQAGPITLTPGVVDFNVIDVKHPSIGERTLLLLFVPGLAEDHSDEVRLAATKLVEALVGEEAFFRWSERVVMEDRERPAEPVAQIERRPLSEVAVVLHAVDREDV